MAKVTGIGGIFVRAKDPRALSAWYLEMLGIPDGNSDLWQQEAGATVFSTFRRESEYFAADRQWMLNLRVDDLKGMIASLEARGVAVEVRDEWDGDGAYGRFARIHDPEGAPIELWEPPK